MTTFHDRVPSPLGDLLLLSDGDCLLGLYFPEHRRGPVIAGDWLHDEAPFAEVREQLAAYLAGDRTDFDVPLAPRGSGFQVAVWDRLRAIPYGTTTTYGAIARDLGRPTAVRAVAGAVARNPISIIVGCHRVVGSAGTITGYAGGLDRKRWLLALEEGAVEGGGHGYGESGAT
jgi:methylated-DNA-[protein]-cysteine S-methyltransferase